MSKVSRFSVFRFRSWFLIRHIRRKAAKHPVSDSSDSDVDSDVDHDHDDTRHPRDVDRDITWLHANPRTRRSWDVDVDAQGDEDDDPRPPRPPPPPPLRRPHPVGLADLDSPAGRRAFISSSLSYLFATTYESSDDMTVSALLTYLNAAMPLDKHEDFDTTEVVKGVTALQDRGKVMLQGDNIKLSD